MRSSSAAGTRGKVGVGGGDRLERNRVGGGR